MLKAIIFDLFETLVTHFDPEWEPPRLSMADRLGISEEDYRKHWGRLDDSWDRGDFDSYEDLLMALCKAAGHTPNSSVVAELTLERSLITPRPFGRIEPEVVDLVRELKSRGFRLAVVTNVSEMDLEPWPDCRLAPFFEAIIASFRVGTLKPDPQIYEQGLQALHVRPDEAIFVGDGGWNELSGAAQVGLRAIWATWFLDRWPLGDRPGKFPGDEWRQFPEGEPSFPRIRSPLALLDLVSTSERQQTARSRHLNPP